MTSVTTPAGQAGADLHRLAYRCRKKILFVLLDHRPSESPVKHGFKILQ